MNEFDIERDEFAKFHKNAEKECLPIYRKALAASIAPVIEWVNQNGIEGVPYEILIKRDVWRRAYNDTYQLIGMRAARKEFYRQRRLDGIAEEKSSAIEFLVDVWSGLLRDYALEYTYLIERDLNRRTVELIRDALGDTFALGLDRTGAIRLFEKTINGVMRARSGTISRTETTTIANLGKEVGARSWIDQTGEQGYHVWLGRIVGERPTHVATNDTILPLEDEYLVGGELALRPGDVRLSPKERISCRCTQSIMSQIRYNAYVKQGRIVDGKLVGAS